MSSIIIFAAHKIIIFNLLFPHIHEHLVQQIFVKAKINILSNRKYLFILIIQKNL